MNGVGEEAGNQRSILWILGTVAVAATIYDFINLLPLFNAFFIRDDYLFLDLGAFMRQQDPLAFLTATCIGWWRPIALLIPALGYLLFGFNPFPFHVLAYSIHLLSGITLLLLCRKFFDLKVGLIAFMIYITAPISFSNVGWMLGAIEDETATIFYLLALYTQFRVNPDHKNGSYILSTIFLVLGSFCKITWLGLIPVMLYMDWVNYPKSPLTQRFHRFVPFLILIPTLFLNFLFIGFDRLGGSFMPNFTAFFTANNLIKGAFFAFIPIDVFQHLSDWFYLMLLIPIIFFLLALILNVKKRLVISVGVAFVGTTAILGLAQIQKDPEGWMMGWRHLTPLIGFAAIVVALIIVGLIRRLKMHIAGWGMAIVLIGAYIYSGLPMKGNIGNEVAKEEQNHRQEIRRFITLCRSFPSASELYIVEQKPAAVNLLADLARNDCELFVIFAKNRETRLMHNYDARSKHVIYGESARIRELLDELIQKPNIRFIGKNQDGLWTDLTDYSKYQLGSLLRLQS
jgi:hypothetical protein